MKFSRILLCFSILAAFAGCATTSGTEVTGVSVASESQPTTLDTKVVVNNRALAKDLEITNVKSALVGNLMKAQVSVRSQSRDTVPVQFKFDWFDAQGFEIASNQSWKPFLVYGNETRSITGVAPDSRAKDFKLKIRDPDAE